MNDFGYLNEELIVLKKRFIAIEKDVALLKKIPKDFTAKDLHKLIDMLSMTLEEFKKLDKDVLGIKGMFEDLEKSLEAIYKKESCKW